MLLLLLLLCYVEHAAVEHAAALCYVEQHRCVMSRRLLSIRLHRTRQEAAPSAESSLDYIQPG